MSSTGKPSVVAHSLIEKVYGCGIRENWMPFKGDSGGSLNSYLPETKQWRQTWVDASGVWVDYSGAWTGQAMVLTGHTPQPDHPDQLTRMTYTVQADGAVRQLAEHYRKSPDLITEDELRQYFLYLKNVKKYSCVSSTIARAFAMPEVLKEIITHEINFVHGKILKPDIPNKVAFINIGSRERVTPGLKFLVGNRGVQGKFEYKAKVEVKKAWMTYCEVAILEIYDKEKPVVEGDGLVNPLFSKDRPIVLAFSPL